jgi:hypothetical protein
MAGWRLRSRLVSAVLGLLMTVHPAMKGVRTFRAYDETYEHRMIADDKTVLMIRDTLNASPPPWTRVRNQGQGRDAY